MKDRDDDDDADDNEQRKSKNKNKQQNSIKFTLSRNYNNSTWYFMWKRQTFSLYAHCVLFLLHNLHIFTGNSIKKMNVHITTLLFIWFHTFYFVLSILFFIIYFSSPFFAPFSLFHMLCFIIASVSHPHNRKWTRIIITIWNFCKICVQLCCFHCSNTMIHRWNIQNEGGKMRRTKTKINKNNENNSNNNTWIIAFFFPLCVCVNKILWIEICFK